MFEQVLQQRYLGTKRFSLEGVTALIPLVDEILDAAGAKKVYRVYIDRITGNCSHQHGTTRMGDDPKTSVLNQYCQAWDVKNLFITDAAPFVSNADKNPTLTITALGWRTSEYIAEQVKKLNLAAA